jgi:hypothetical protein
MIKSLQIGHGFPLEITQPLIHGALNKPRVASPIEREERLNILKVHQNYKW